MKCIVCGKQTEMKMQKEGIEAALCYDHLPHRKIELMITVR